MRKQVLTGLAACAVAAAAVFAVSGPAYAAAPAPGTSGTAAPAGARVSGSGQGSTTDAARNAAWRNTLAKCASHRVAENSLVVEGDSGKQKNGSYNVSLTITCG